MGFYSETFVFGGSNVRYMVNLIVNVENKLLKFSLLGERARFQFVHFLSV